VANACVKAACEIRTKIETSLPRWSIQPGSINLVAAARSVLTQ
jgi:hypothetical protein